MAFVTYRDLISILDPAPDDRYTGSVVLQNNLIALADAILDNTPDLSGYATLTGATFTGNISKTVGGSGNTVGISTVSSTIGQLVAGPANYMGLLLASGGGAGPRLYLSGVAGGYASLYGRLLVGPTPPTDDTSIPLQVAAVSSVSMLTYGDIRVYTAGSYPTIDIGTDSNHSFSLSWGLSEQKALIQTKSNNFDIQLGPSAIFESDGTLTGVGAITSTGTGTFANTVTVSGVAAVADARVIITRGNSSKASWFEFDTGGSSTQWLFGQSGSSTLFSINYWDGAADHLFQTISTSGNVAFSNDVSISGKLVVPTSTPASSSATGTTGTITWDSSYIYVCVSTNAWKRVAIASW